MGGTAQNTKNRLICLFTNCTYDSSLIYHIFLKKHRILQFGDSSDCAVKLMELGYIHKSKVGIFKMTSDNGLRLETLYWSSSLSKSFVPNCSDFVLIDGTHKTNIYDLSLVVTNVVVSLGKSVPLGLLLAPSEHSDSTTRNMNILKIIRTNCIDPSFVNTHSIMTNEGPALVKVASNIAGYHHCLFDFHINQLAVRVNNIFYHANIHFVIQNVCCQVLSFIMSTYMSKYKMCVVI